MIVLDTNVVSELMRPRPESRVRSWLLRAGIVTTTAVTVAEIRFGIERLPAGRRRDGLDVAADETMSIFGQDILPFDLEAAVRYPRIVTDPADPFCTPAPR